MHGSPMGRKRQHLGLDEADKVGAMSPRFLGVLTVKREDYDEHLRPDEIERLAELDEAKRDITREKRQIRQRLRARFLSQQQRRPENG